MNIHSTITNIRNRVTEFASRATLQEWLLYILIVLIPFSIRHTFISEVSFATGAYSDFTTYSIYLSDFILIAFLIVSFFAQKNDSRETHKIPKIWLWSGIGFASWLLINLIAQHSALWHFQVYFTVRLLVLIIFLLIVAKVRVPRENIAWIFTIFGAVQGIIAIFQFYMQHSLGLYIVGESHISPQIVGAAKIVAHGTTLIRGYGTFPHPNILGGFLVLTTLLNLYLLIKTTQKPRGIFITILLFLNIFGLCLTFSRGALVSSILGVLTFSTILLIQKQFSRGTKALSAFLFSLVICTVILAPYIGSRATFNDAAVKQRSFYNEIGLNMIKKIPILGLGQGLSIFHMKQYTDKNLQPYEIQPIHNIPILVTAEVGILGSFLTFIFVLLPIFALFKGKLSTIKTLYISIIVSYGTISLIDHYFYTTWPAMLMGAVVLGYMTSVSRETIYKT